MRVLVFYNTPIVNRLLPGCLSAQDGSHLKKGRVKSLDSRLKSGIFQKKGWDVRWENFGERK